MSDKPTFRAGDIVRLVKPFDSPFSPAVGTEHTIQNAHPPDDFYTHGLYGPIGSMNIEPEYLELVYRAADRAEVEALRAGLLYACDLFDNEGGDWRLTDPLRKLAREGAIPAEIPEP